MALSRFERFLALASWVLVAVAAGLSVSGTDSPYLRRRRRQHRPLLLLHGVATEELGKHTGPAMGGLLNASFGNAAELIIGIFALLAGPQLTRW